MALWADAKVECKAIVDAAEVARKARRVIEFIPPLSLKSTCFAGPHFVP
jgi:hypothetical protein